MCDAIMKVKSLQALELHKNKLNLYNFARLRLALISFSKTYLAISMAVPVSILIETRLRGRITSSSSKCFLE